MKPAAVVVGLVVSVGAGWGRIEGVRRSMSLRQRLLLLQVAIVVLTTGVVGGVALRMQEAQIGDSYEARLIGLALAVATLPAIVAASDEPAPPAVIQPIAEVIREA